jgi:intracellular septation protein A
MRKSLLNKLKESAKSVLPLSAIIFLLHFTIAPMPVGTLSLVVVGTVLLLLGMAFFMLGADMALVPMGEIIGSELTKTRKLWLLLLGCFALGVVVTIAEPDLQVLTKQVPSVPDVWMIASVALGVGIFLVIALLRILFRVRQSVLYVALYALVFLIAAVTSPDYLAVGFDSGGVTTGPITVPFILALGIGLSSVRGSGSSEEDSFGLCAICSIGPVLAILILGMFFDISGTGFAFETVSSVGSLGELASVFAKGFLRFLAEAVVVLLPIIAVFGLAQIIHLKLPKSQVIKIGVGVLYTLFGLTVLLTGINIGFMPAGTYLGNAIASMNENWILIPLGCVIGFFVIVAEPAVHVLNKQVEEITSGTISQRMMRGGLSIAVGLALALVMVRVIFSINIWYFLLPGYAVALAMTFFVPEIFTAIAFDSGGIAAGSMTAAFLLPFTIGVCNALGGNVMTDAFGVVAMVAMMPLITLQVMGMIYKLKIRRVRALEALDAGEGLDDAPQAETQADQGDMEPVQSDVDMEI